MKLAEHHLKIILECASSILAVPADSFAVLVVSPHVVDVRSVPQHSLEDLLTGVLNTTAITAIRERLDGAIATPAYRERFVLFLEVHDSEAEWEPPNVHGVGATVVVIGHGAVGSA